MLTENGSYGEELSLKITNLRGVEITYVSSLTENSLLNP
jgi:hypothetical protein